MKKLIVGISAADGVRIGQRLLELLWKMPEVETHLVISRAAERNFQLECGANAADVKALADHCYEPEDMSAAIASGSFITEGMIVAPCSMKTLSAIAHGYADNLLVRSGRLPEGETSGSPDATGDAAEPDSLAEPGNRRRGRLCYRAADDDLLQPSRGTP